MSAAVVRPGRNADGRTWEYLLQSWRELDVPEGWRAEIDGGQIALVPPRHRHHHGIAERVQRALYPFGGKLELPEPFALTLETDAFPH